MSSKLGKFHFTDSLPHEVVKGLPDFFLKNEYIVPEWCHEVQVIWDPEPQDEDGNASGSPAYTDTHYEYRYATVAICPSFLAEEPDAKDKIIKHELGHIVTAPLVDHMAHVLQLLDLDETVVEVIKHGIQQNMEAVTEDFTLVVLKAEANTKNERKKGSRAAKP